MFDIKKMAVWSLLIGTTLACLTNQSLSQIPTPRPTRTPIPTFTVTPIPPTATPVPDVTNTPTALPEVETPEPVAEENLLPTDTPVPEDTATPFPTDTPPPTPVPPTPTPPPPTPVPPTPTPEFVNNSPIPTPVPTNTPGPGTPAGQYEAFERSTRPDCTNFFIAVEGKVYERDHKDRPVQWVQIEVTGVDDDDDESTYHGREVGVSDAEGRYGIFLGKLDEVGGKEFKVKVIGGPNVVSEDTVEWRASKDCKDDGDINIKVIDWAQEPND